jgi:MFS family permease
MFVRSDGMRKFTLIWFCQMLSMFGTATTRFALLVWAYQQTGEATTTALLGFFSFILYIPLSPLAGVIVDRFDRRIIMILADVGAGSMTALLLVLYSSNNLQIWHLYLAELMLGAFDAFYINAYGAAITMLVPKEQYARVNGMRSLAYSASQVIAPVMAGLILGVIGLRGVLTIDTISYVVGVSPLLFILIPHPKMDAAKPGDSSHFWQDVTFGFRYIWARAGLRGLLINFTGINLVAALTYFAVLAPMVLARTGGDELALGSVQSAIGVAGVLGGIVMSVWGGPKKRIHGVLFVGALSFLFGDFLTAVGRTTPVWMLGGFIGTFFVPIIVACDRSIWQSKVEPALQGRVFAAQGMVQQMMMPFGYLVAGPLADRFFEPAMQANGMLAPIFGGLVGTGAGAGMGLMFLCTCVMGTAICLGGYLFPSVRNVERDLPDHDVSPELEGERIEAAA